MRNLLIFIPLLVLPLLSRSGNISAGQAATVARNFFYERSAISNNTALNDIHTNNIRAKGTPTTAFYICEMKPEGFVVVSASDKVIPVLAYSFESAYEAEEAIPAGFNAWMDHYTQQIAYAITNNIVPSFEIAAEWQRLLAINFDPKNDIKLLSNVAPLLVSKWDQGVPYNGLCPSDPAGPGGHCLTGCVATCMGQLLYYYRFPQQGQGSYSYTHPDYGTLAANFGDTEYHWEGMPSGISKTNGPIAGLLNHQGVSVDMDYGPDGSGMWNHKAAYSLRTYFRYGPETQYYFRDSVTIDWDSLLVTNLDQRKPLYYAGWAGVQSTSGHAFVCDGYQPGNYYHFNWGWGGSQDGYFYTANLTPGGNNFNFAQEVIPMFPDTIQNIYPYPCQGLTTLTGLRGSLEDGSGWYDYQDNASCSWLIAPQDVEYDSIKNITLTFLRFDTEAGADSLYLYDGPDASAPLIAAYSGDSVPGIITTSGNKVFVVFHSNSSVTKAGFQLDYESHFPVYCSGTTTLTTPMGNIEDGSGDKKYSSSSMCRWKITPSDGMPLTFRFNSFDTFDSLDIVKVYDLQTQEVLGIFSGNQLPSPLTAMSGKMMILFLTNANGSAQGWSGSYSTSGVGLFESDTCPVNAVVYPNPTTGNLTVVKYFSGSSQISIRILDLKGEELYSKNFSAFPGKNTFSIEFTGYTGTAYLEISTENGENDVKNIVILSK